MENRGLLIAFWGSFIDLRSRLAFSLPCLLMVGRYDMCGRDLGRKGEEMGRVEKV